MVATWSVAVGWLVFLAGMIIGFFMFNRYKKFYPLFYLVSICVYAFTLAYAIDVLHLNRIGILISLIVSAGIFLSLGNHFARIIKEVTEKKKR